MKTWLAINAIDVIKRLKIAPIFVHIFNPTTKNPCKGSK